jgi:hypothetical protein
VGGGRFQPETLEPETLNLEPEIRNRPLKEHLILKNNPTRTTQGVVKARSSLQQAGWL